MINYKVSLHKKGQIKQYFMSKSTLFYKVKLVL